MKQTALIQEAWQKVLRRIDEQDPVRLIQAIAELVLLERDEHFKEMAPEQWKSMKDAVEYANRDRTRNP